MLSPRRNMAFELAYDSIEKDESSARILTQSLYIHLVHGVLGCCPSDDSDSQGGQSLTEMILEALQPAWAIFSWVSGPKNTSLRNLDSHACHQPRVSAKPDSRIFAKHENNADISSIIFSRLSCLNIFNVN